MIKVFGYQDRDFSSNGDVVLRPLKAKIHKEDNGAFYLDLETGLEYAECLTEGRIVAVDTPSGTQLFRLHNVTMTRKKVTTRAYHIFYDAEDYIIPSTFINNKICSEALNQLNAATDVPSPFTFSSDVETITSFECVRQSLKNAVFTVLERWGGHLSFDGFNVAIKRQIGRDNGVTVRYAKNLRDIQVSYDWDGVVTKLLPVGKDGILLNAIDPNASLYVYADVEYPLHYCKTVNFNQSLRQEDFDTEDEYKQALVNDLRSQAQIYVDGNCYPKVNYTLKANLDRISDVGDVIEVIDYRLGLQLETNLIAYDWDCLLKRFTECEFGNFRRKLSDLFSTIDRNTANTVFRASSDLSDRINATDQTVENLSGEVGTVATATETLTDTLTAKAGTTKSYSGVCGGMMNASEIRFSIPVQDMSDKTVTLTELTVTVTKSGGTVVLNEQDVTSDSAVLNHGNTLLIIISDAFTADVVAVEYSIEVSIS